MRGAVPRGPGGQSDPKHVVSGRHDPAAPHLEGSDRRDPQATTQAPGQGLHQFARLPQRIGRRLDGLRPLFKPGNTVADGLKFAKQRGGRRDLHIFVGNSRRELVGAVSVGDLVRSDPQTKLSEIMDPGVQALSNRATLASVADQPQWDDYPMLPVVGRRKQVLGGLSRSSLSKGLEEDRVFRPGLAPSSVLTELFIGYFVTCSGLLRLVSEPASPKQEPES